MDSVPPNDNKFQPPYPGGYPPPASPPSYLPPGAYPPPAQPYSQPNVHMPYPPTASTTYYPQAPQQPQQQQQQQQSVVVVNAANPVPTIVQSAPVESYVGYIAFACVVFWCCNALFGLIAFILAIVADTQKYKDLHGARRLGKASLWLSITGIIVTVIIIAIALGVGLSTVRTCSYSVYGICYRSRRYAYCYQNTFYYCCNTYDDLYYSGYCYTA